MTEKKGKAQSLQQTDLPVVPPKSKKTKERRFRRDGAGYLPSSLQLCEDSEHEKKGEEHRRADRRRQEKRELGRTAAIQCAI